MIETLVILLIYSIFMVTTYCKIGFKYLGLQDHCTIWMFWITELLYLVLFIWELTLDEHNNGQAFDATLFGLINFVLLYYLYQMRVVQIKLESEDPAQFMK